MVQPVNGQGPKQQTPRTTMMVDQVIQRHKLGAFKQFYMNRPGLAKLVGTLTGGGIAALADRAVSNWIYTGWTLFFTVAIGMGFGWLISALSGTEGKLKSAVDKSGRLEETSHSFSSQVDGLKQQISDKDLVIKALREAAGGIYEGAEFEEYRVDQRLGEGNFGIVWKIFDTNLEKYFVLKHADPNSPFSEKAIELFDKEAKLLAKLEHPNVVRIYRFFKNLHGTPAFIMEFVDGEVLSETIRKKGVPPLVALDIMSQILNGLEYAHTKGIVHRDLKPENLMKTNGIIKILDFGIGKKAEGAKTAAGPRKTQAGVGTPFYMAWEQYGLGDKPSDWKTDLWAWSVIFWEILTGTVPFFGNNPQEVMGALFQQELIEMNLPQNLERRLTLKQRQYIFSVFDWLLGKHPEQRKHENRLYPTPDKAYGKLREILGAMKVMFKKMEEPVPEFRKTDRQTFDATKAERPPARRPKK